MPARFPRQRGGIGVGLARAVAATWLLLLLELLVVAALNARQLASSWELRSGTQWLAPTVLAASSVVALLSAFGWALAEHAQRRWIRAFLAVSVAAAAGAVGFGVGGGRHLSTAAARGGFSAAVALAAGLGAYALLPLLAEQLRRRPGSVGLGCALLLVAVELVNRFALVRLYPAFHLGLSLLTLLLVPGALFWNSTAKARKASPDRARRAAWGVPIVLVAAVLLARPAARRLAYFDNYRLLLLDRAPLLANGVRLAAELAPPAPAPSDGCESTGSTCSGDAPVAQAPGSGVDFANRDLLLVTIDALRADHVGIYGYSRATTPNIDALAKRGALFEHTYAATPHTSYSVTSIMTGKYMHPLLLQGAGQDSETWAGLLRTYGYRTAAFYPPAVFFIDPANFESFSRDHLGFEYGKVEFLEGDGRVAQVEQYIDSIGPNQRLFVWVHLFGPHEPYEIHPGHDFGGQDLDRYDSEVAYADETTGKLIRAFERKRPNGVVIVSADHGEEFGDHGGRYHGTTVYEEQVRVPLVIAAAGAVSPRRIPEPVQTIDLLPTVLQALSIPRPPRLRGRDLGALLSGKPASDAGLALAETEEQSLLAEGTLRLVCARRVGACKLFDVREDPHEQTDVSSEQGLRFRELRERQRALSASHGRFEERGLRAEGKGWPAAILRGVSGDGDAAEEIAALLDDADLAIRRKAAELLFELSRPESAPALRLALGRDEDPEVKRWCALALTRLGQGAPLAYELVKSEDLKWRRLAALALGQVGDKRGEETLVLWWRDAQSRDFTRSRELLDAFAAIRSKDAVYPLTQSLGDVRLRPFIARTLAAIGDEAARGFLARALKEERYQSARIALARALVDLKGEGELIEPLVRFLGVPDPLPGGLEFARRAKILEHIGGPSDKALARLKKESSLGVALTLVVPRGGNGQGVRALIRAKNFGSEAAVVRLGARKDPIKYNSKGEPIKDRDIPKIDTTKQLEFRIQPGPDAVEVYAQVPESLAARPGRAVELVAFADRAIELEAVALVPLSDELPPPPPEPWR